MGLGHSGSHTLRCSRSKFFLVYRFGDFYIQKSPFYNYDPIIGHTTGVRQLSELSLGSFSQCEYSFCSGIDYKSYSVQPREYDSIDYYDPRKPSTEKLDLWYFCAQLSRFLKNRLIFHDLKNGQWYRWNARGDGIYNTIEEGEVLSVIRTYVRYFNIQPKRSLILDAYEEVKYSVSLEDLPKHPEVERIEDGEVVKISGEEMMEPYSVPDNYPEYERLRYVNVLFAFNNGLFNWVTGELLPFTPYVFVTDSQRIYCNWNPNANGDAAFRTYRGLFKDERTLNTLWDMMAYCLYRTPFSEVYPYIWFLHGEGGTGKTMIYTIIQRLLGDNAGTTPAKILCARFGPTSLIGKRVNLANEVDRGLLDAQWMKEFADGTGIDGKVTIEEKYRNPRQVNINASLVFASNNQVSFGSDSGIARRLRVIPMDVKQDEQARIYQYVLTEDALSWIAWVLFERWIEIQKRNGAIEETIDVTKASNEMMRAGSSVREFFYESYDLEEREDVADYIVNDSSMKIRSRLYQMFAEYCTMTGRSPISRNEFNLQVKTEYGLKEERKRISGLNPTYVWVRK